MKLLCAAAFSLLSVSGAFASQTILCKNPDLQLQFNPNDVENLNETSVTVADYGLDGKATSVSKTAKYVTFTKTDFAEVNVSVPSDAVGTDSNSVTVIYSDATPESYTPRAKKDCTSSISAD